MSTNVHMLKFYREITLSVLARAARQLYPNYPWPLTLTNNLTGTPLEHAHNYYKEQSNSCSDTFNKAGHTKVRKGFCCRYRLSAGDSSNTFHMLSSCCIIRRQAAHINLLRMTSVDICGRRLSRLPCTSMAVVLLQFNSTFYCIILMF